MNPEIASAGDIGSPESDDHSQQDNPGSPKRKASTAGLNVNASGRPVKRRASKACQCCRARKVRCNVVEHGAPCTNCRLDEVPCIVTESKRRKKHSYHNLKPPTAGLKGSSQPHVHGLHGLSTADALASGSVNPSDISNSNMFSSNHSVSSSNDQDDDQMPFHVPHTLYQKRLSGIEQGQQPPSAGFATAAPLDFHSLVNSAAIGGDLRATRLQHSPPPIALAPPPPPVQPQARYTNGLLPLYIKPLPPRMALEDVGHLWKKGALAIPDTVFRNELLRSYIEYVHPYMPLIELHDFLNIVDKGTGENGKISLLLFQAVMFTGVAFVDMSYLIAAGYPTRKAARKAFYLKTRTLYDFDYESDRVAIVQALLLMTYWYETPDDQKDTWHWMGVAISLAHTIGLHRNPLQSTMDVRKQKLWKRIWWSCFMRDRLVALGMRRPTRIKDEDYDVPMLTMDDFEIMPLAADNSTISTECRMIREVSMQRDLAFLCIAKAKLCLCISHVLSAQYSVLVRDQGMAVGQEGSTRSSVMLFPKKLDQTDEVKICDSELADWIQSLPAPCLYKAPTTEEIENGGSTVIVQRALLHMCYYATLSALHRPQVLPSAETASLQKCRELQDVSRRKVREASREITRMSQCIHKLNLTGYLPTTGVTVLLPAIIIHLLDIKSFSDSTREEALQGFCQCMQVLEKLRDNYAAADFATQFLEAAIRKADIDVNSHQKSTAKADSVFKVPQPKHMVQSVSHLVDVGRTARLTPPPDSSNNNAAFSIPAQTHAADSIGSKVFVANDAGQFPTTATTPPNSDAYSSNSSNDEGAQARMMAGFDMLDHHQHDHSGTSMGDEGVFQDQFDALINFDGDNFGADAWDMDAVIEDGMGMHGESGGFVMDMDSIWMKDGTAAEGFNWVAGSPQEGIQIGSGAGGMQQQQQHQQQGVGIETQQREGLSDEEKAIFLLAEPRESVAV